jgi:hypothetical protein
MSGDDPSLADASDSTEAGDPHESLVPLLSLATDWLARSGGTNIPLELTVHDLRWKGDWRLSIYRTPQDLEGVSVVMPRGDWFLEARGSSAAAFLANAAAVDGRRPATLTTSEAVSALVRPLLSEAGAIDREHKLWMLRSTQPPALKEGRWATADDLPRLREYETHIDRAHVERMDTSWEGLIARKELAVAAEGDHVAASIRRYGAAPSFAGIADLFALDAGGDISARLTGFVVGELLAGREAVYVFVDEADTAALAFYRGLGFEAVGTCYQAHLK